MKKWLFKGSGATVISDFFDILIHYLPVLGDILGSVFLLFSEKSNCKSLRPTISIPIEIEKGICFGNYSNTQKATIQLVTHIAIKYTNFKGSFSCYTGETHSFLMT